MKREPEPQIKVAELKKGLPLISWLLIAFAIFALLLALPSCAPAAPTTEALAKEVTVSQAASLRDAGAFVLDVREQEEWNAFHIPGATLIPLGQLQSRLSEVPKDKQILVVCRTGHRSANGRDVLLAAGYPQVTSMAGGVTEWQSQGLPTVTGP
jgi:rhodanese-related sulfurtransferase